MRQPERVVDLLDKEIPPVISWVGKGVLAKRNLMVLCGTPKLGKSLYSLEFSRALTTGTHVFGHPQMYTEACRVLYIDMEIGEFGLQERIAKVFKHEDREVWGNRFWYISQCAELKLDTQDGRNILFNALEQTQANILILDPAKNLHSYDENSNTEIAKFFATLHSVKSAFVHNDLSIIVNHHSKKPPEKDSRIQHDPLDPFQARGASNWYADPDTMFMAHRNRELPRPEPDWTAWETTNRVIMRNDGSIADFRMTVNRDAKDDLRVRFESVKGELLPLKEKDKPLPGTLKGEQQKMGFIGAE